MHIWRISKGNCVLKNYLWGPRLKMYFITDIIIKERSYGFEIMGLKRI